MAQYQREEAIDQKQAEGQVGKDVVGNGGAVAVSVEGREHEQVLLRHDDYQTKKEPDRKRCRESFEDKSAEDGHGKLDDGRPHGRHLER